ncbi:MAG: cobalamin biosynthesis protein [Spirochaetaceae bacterium]|jgi:cobalt-precorrin 5A hydrolase|nr:cobalamin biosynthesis protein [Spirochaetaceae bacterium]
MKIAFFSFTDCGALLKSRLCLYFSGKGHEIFAKEPASSLKEQAAAAFREADALVFIGAAGIAVRTIAPFVCSKLSDPSLVVIDELGKWVIPLLGGHIGGGNEFALELAGFLHSEAVITTATDIHGVFAVDLWASRQDLAIDSMEKAKRVSAALLKGSEIRLWSDYPIAGTPPYGIVYDCGREAADTFGILVSMKRSETGADLLRLIPRRLYVGIGCRKGTPAEAIAELFDYALESLCLDGRCVAGAASIDIKRAERGLLEFCESRALPCSFFDKATLEGVEGHFSASDFVRKAAGVDNVCERAAVAASESGKLLLRKTARGGVTIAAALKQTELSF